MAIKDEWIGRVLKIAVARPGGEGADAPSKSAERAQEARAANRRGIAYPKMLLRWEQAQKDARSALDGIGKAYLAIPGVQADPRYGRVQAAMARLPGLIPELGEDLRDLLDRGINAGTDAGIAQEALAVIRTYRASLNQASKLSAFEQFARQHVGELAVLSTLDGALAEIANNLQASV